MAGSQKESRTERQVQETADAVMAYIVRQVGFLPLRNAEHIRYHIRHTPALAFGVYACEGDPREFWAEAEIDPATGEVEIEYNERRDPEREQPRDLIHEAAEAICETRVAPTLYAGRRGMAGFRILATGADCKTSLGHLVACEVQRRFERIWDAIDECRAMRARCQAMRRSVHDFLYWSNHVDRPELETVRYGGDDDWCY